MSNKYTLVFAPQVERDLDEIYSYITYELQNNQAASKLINEIEKAFIALEDMPNRCVLCDEPELRRNGYRKCFIKSFVALFTIDENKKTVKVMKVVYGMRDFNKLEF